MTLSNNAIKFLQAQYRAIFKRAYVKGLATAVLVTAGLAASSANAEVYLYTQSINKPLNVANQYEIVAGATNADNKQYNVDEFEQTVATIASGKLDDLGDFDTSLATGIASGIFHSSIALEGEMTFFNVAGAVNLADATTATGGNLTIGGEGADINGNIVRKHLKYPQDEAQIDTDLGGSAFGGMALNSGDAFATSNILTVQADKYADAAVVGGYAISTTGDASSTNNILNYTSSKVVQGIDDSAVAKTLAGGYARINATSGTLTLSGNTLNLGSASNASATDIAEKDYFAGGFGRFSEDSPTGTLKISNNVANLTNVTLSSAEAKYIVGGGSDKGAGSASMTGNQVVLKDVTVSGEKIVIAGAYAAVDIDGMTASSNSVTVDADSVITDASIYGTYSADGYYETETGGKIQLEGTYNVGALKTATLAANQINVTGKVENKGTLNIAGDTLNLSATAAAGLFSDAKTSKLQLASGTDVVVTGDTELDLSDLKGNNLVASGNNTWTQDNVKLGTTFNSEHLAFDVKKLTAETAPYTNVANENNAFVIEQGEISVSNSVTLNHGTEDDAEHRIYVIANDEDTFATLNLVNDGSLLGQLNNVDRLYVGLEANSYTASGTSTLKVDGHWDFGGARLAVNTSGTANLNGTVDNIGILQIDKKGVVKIGSNADVTVGRLLGGQDAIDGNKISIDGTLTIKGDGNKDDKNASGDAVNDIKLTTAKIEINNGGTLAITGDAVDNVVNDSGAVITTNWSGSKVTLNAGGTLSLDLGDITLTQAQLGSLKSDLVNTGYKGSFDFGDSLTIKLEDDSLQTAIDNGEVTYAQLSGAGINDVKGIADGVTVSVTSTEATKGIKLSNGASAVKLASGTTSVAVDGTLALNGNGSNFVYAENTPDAPAEVSVKANSGVNLTGNGTVGSLTKENGVSNTTAYLTHDQSDVQTVQGKIDLDEVTIGAGSVNVTQSVTAGELTVNGNLNVSGGAGAITITGTGDSVATIAGSVQAGAISSSGGMDVTGTILAESISLAANKNLTVGDASNSGLVEVETLDLNGGMLLIDPDWNQKASIVTVKNANTNDVINVSGSIGVGRNSVGVFGATTTEAQESLNRLGLLQASKLDEHGIGSALYLGKTLQVDNQKHVLVDKTMDNAALNAELTRLASTSSGSVTLRDGSALVISESFSDELVDDQNKAIFEFAATTGTVSVSAESGAKIIFDSADILGNDSVKVATAGGAGVTITTALGNAEITAAGGLLVGTADDTDDTITFRLAQNAADHLYNQSNPIRDMTLDVVGNLNGAYDSADAGVYYIGAMNAHNGGADIERTARMALYGGAVQATLMAQQTSTDAISERLGMANPNSALITSNNAQGGGLWLSPVYKNHDSDEFEAEGVNYGADIDLYGLALGADFTTESGVRVGAMFNVGSGDAEGQGIGEGVSNDFDYYGFSLYAGVTFGNFALTADAGFTQVSNDLEQAVNYHGVGTLKADTDTQTVSVGVRGEYLFATPWVDVVPHVGVRYTSFDLDSYQAQVDGYTIASADADSMQLFSIPFGVTFSKDMAMGNWVVKPIFDLNLTANAGDDELESDVAFVGVSNVALTTEVMDSFTYGATLGVSAQYQESFSFGLNVGYTGSSSADEFGLNANARYTF